MGSTKTCCSSKLWMNYYGLNIVLDRALHGDYEFDYLHFFWFVLSEVIPTIIFWIPVVSVKFLQDDSSEYFPFLISCFIFIFFYGMFVNASTSQLTLNVRIMFCILRLSRNEHKKFLEFPQLLTFLQSVFRASAEVLSYFWTIDNYDVSTLDPLLFL